MTFLRFRDSAVRLLRPLAAAGLVVAAPGCGERATAGPGIASRASVAVAPSYQPASTGGPVILLDRVEGWLVPIPAADSAFAKAMFEGESAALAFDVVVTGLEQRFVFRLAAFDAVGTRIFASVDTILVRPGENEAVEGIALTYVAPDAEVTDFVVDGRTTWLVVGDTVHLRARACCTSDEQLFPVRAGWMSRDPLVATADQGSGIVTAVAPGRAWIVATLFNGAQDSLEVAVGDPIASVTIESPPASLGAIGDAVTLVAVARDAAGAPLGAGILWRSLDPGVATVDPATGTVTGATNGTARIVAEAGGKADTLAVVVEQVAASVEATAESQTLNAIGHWTTLAAVARDANGYPLPSATMVGFVAITSLDGGRLTIGTRESSTSVRATAEAVGEGWAEAWLYADSSGAVRLADTVIVAVRQIPASVAISPSAHAMYPGESVVLAAEVRDSAGTLIPAPSVTWKSGDPAVAMVDAAGVVTATTSGTATIEGWAGEARGEATIDVLASPPTTRTWVGGDAADPTGWSNPRNWSPAGAPTAADTVVVPVTSFAPTLKEGATVDALSVVQGATLVVDGALTVTGGAAGGDIGGVGTLTVLGDLEAASSTIAVSVLRLAGARGTEGLGALGSGHASLELLGDMQPLRSGLAYRGVRVVGSARLVGPEAVTFDGSLVIEGDAAQLLPSGVPLVVTGDLLTGAKGVLAMTNDADQVTVKGAATIDGGATAPAFVYGTLHVGRDFTVLCKTAECFQPGANGNFTVRFDGLEKQTIALALPGAPGDGNHLQQFRNVRVSNASGVTFATGAAITGNLLVDAEAVATIPEGIWVDVVGTLTLDRSGATPGRIDNFGELYAGVDDTSGEVKPNPVLPRK